MATAAAAWEITFDQYLFYEACIEGNLAAARRLWALRDKNGKNNGLSSAGTLLTDLDTTFLAVCSDGHLAISQWLWGLGLLPREILPSAIVLACHRKHLGVARWLWEMGPPGAAAVARAVYRQACRDGNTAVAQWARPHFGESVFKDAFLSAWQSRDAAQRR